jgi:uracil-DNA glycosylase
VNAFNPARLNLRMMRQQMPLRDGHLPLQAHDLPVLLRAAGGRVQAMAEHETLPARRRVPGRPRQS